MVTTNRRLFLAFMLFSAIVLAACGNSSALEGQWRLVQFLVNGQPSTNTNLGDIVTVTPTQLISTLGSETKVSTRQGTVVFSAQGARGTLSLRGSYLVITETVSGVLVEAICERTP